MYIEEIALHNFKSFKNSVIHLNNGFNCIVGPNGSGKSSVCDSILFALGEPSLKRLRITSYQNIINNSVRSKNKKEAKKAHVIIKFNGTKKIEIQKSIDSNNNIVYRLDGKRVSRQNITDLLKAYKAEINNTNTMIQGEIIQVSNQNAKERRALIDTAAGIKQFDEKKDTALKELDKVDLKINEANILLNERFGFLKELKKEKDEAEYYTDLTRKSKLFNFVILKEKEQNLLKMYEENTNKLNENSGIIKKMQEQVSDITAQIKKLSDDKIELTKKMNQDSSDSGALNRNLNELNKQIAINESELNTFNASVKNLIEKLILSKQEFSEIQQKLKHNTELINKLAIQISDSEEKSKKFNIKAKSIDNTKLIEEYESLDKELDTHNKIVSDTNQNIIKNEMQVSNIKSELNELSKKIIDAQQELKNNESSIKNMNSDIESIDKIINNHSSRIKEFSEKNKELYKKIEEIDSKILNIKENIAISKSNSGIELNSILKNEIKTGFYGYVYELYSCDEKYNTLIHASTGNRLNYFVVDSIETANKAINILKIRRLGSASFIPINDLIVKQTKPIQNAEPLINLVSFDKKYEKVFQYVFFNTYFIKDIDYAKKVGLGSYRFVTIDGEVIEPSGIISGGSFKINKKYYQLESELNSLNLQKKELIQVIEKTSEEIELVSKTASKYEMQKLDKTIEIKHIQNNANNLLKLLDNLNSLYKSKNLIEYKDLVQKNESLKSTQAEQEKIIKMKKERIKALYSNIGNLINEKESDSENETRSNLLKQIEQEKIQHASLTKENEMLNMRLKQLKNEISASEKSKEDAKIHINDIESKLRLLKQNLLHFETELKTKYKNSDAIFSQISDLDNLMSKLSIEKGKIESNLEKISRENIETNLSKQHTQMRLNDIKAEINIINKDEINQLVKDLNGKKNTADADDSTGAGSIENISFRFIQSLFNINEMHDLEVELDSLKKELEKLQTVNLKAPEIFLLKQKEFNEVQQKLDTLKNEKNSILEMINEIEGRKLNIFNETFNSVSQNMKKLYSIISQDEQINLRLDKPLDPFNSGLYIDLVKQENKKSIKSIDTLSGGEKSLVLIILLLSIQMRNLLSFYLFDEIDTALDKENSKKLSRLIKELSRNSQFIVVSHNDSLIVDADTAIGIAKQNDESKAIGVQIDKLKIENQ